MLLLLIYKCAIFDNFGVKLGVQVAYMRSSLMKYVTEPLVELTCFRKYSLAGPFCDRHLCSYLVAWSGPVSPFVAERWHQFKHLGGFERACLVCWSRVSRPIKEFLAPREIPPLILCLLPYEPTNHSRFKAFCCMSQK